LPKVYIASEARHYEAERTCSNCAYKWVASFDIKATSMAQSTGKKAAQEARAIVAAERKEKLENCDVVCPECSHFSEDAMRRHFKAGYAMGIVRKYKRAAWASLGEGLAAAALPTILFFVANLNPFNSTNRVWSAIGLSVCLYLGSIAVSKLVAFVWGLAAASATRSRLQQLSDPELLALAVGSYKANKNSLQVSFMDTLWKWSPWLSKVLFYKPDAPIAEKVSP